MSEVESHYESLLSEVYTWMYGGFESAAERNRAFFAKHDIKPGESDIALDLGAGSGFQSIPLAELGFRVKALDLSADLLEELRSRAGDLKIETIRDDILNLRAHCAEPAAVIVCMTDTLNHLPALDSVTELFKAIHDCLRDGGRFIATFRDLSRRLDELNRFIPLRSDENTIFTCFLEYEDETVKVHDLVHRRTGSGWELRKSFYRKLILAPDWITSRLEDLGFALETNENENGMISIIARR